MGGQAQGREAPARRRGVRAPLHDAAVGVERPAPVVEVQAELRMFLEVMRRTGHLLSVVVAGVWMQKHCRCSRQVHYIGRDHTRYRPLPKGLELWLVEEAVVQLSGHRRRLCQAVVAKEAAAARCEELEQMG